MSRKIMFRAKDISGKQWVYGYLTIMWGLKHIQDFNDENTAYEIDPDTLGQYTGLTDKNGKEVYEGDALGYVDDSLKLGVVKYESHGFIIDWGKDCHMSKHILNLSDRFEVIGNIHDNPELLEK